MSRDEGDQTTRFALPFLYGIYTLSSNGELGFIELEQPATFHPPTTAFDANDKRSIDERYEQWLSSWTPISAAWKSHDDLLIEYQTWNPLKYTIDVWDSKHKTLLRSVHTNYRFVSTSGKRAWFVDDTLMPGNPTQLMTGDFSEK